MSSLDLDLLALRDEALDAARGIKDPTRRVLNMTRLADKRFGDTAERDEVLAEAADIARRIEDPEARATALTSVLLVVK